MARIATMKVWAVDLGLAVHVEAPNGRYIVIDLGSKDGVSPLQALSGKDVGYMVITHPHHDHFSDIKNLNSDWQGVLWRVKAYTRDELLDGVRDSEKDDFVKYCVFTSRFTSTVSRENNPATGILFGGLTAKVFSAIPHDKSNKNNFSAIVVLQLGNTKVVVCGDNEKESLDILTKKNDFIEAVANASVLVAPHHGRESGFHAKFVNYVNPKITIISDTAKGETSVTEKYDEKTRGHEVLNRSKNEIEERKCLTTRNDGNIVVRFGEYDNTIIPNPFTVYSHCQ